jgi:hypothetical protein
VAQCRAQRAAVGCSGHRKASLSPAWSKKDLVAAHHRSRNPCQLPTCWTLHIQLPQAAAAALQPAGYRSTTHNHNAGAAGSCCTRHCALHLALSQHQMLPITVGSCRACPSCCMSQHCSCKPVPATTVSHPTITSLPTHPRNCALHLHLNQLSSQLQMLPSTPAGHVCLC